VRARERERERKREIEEEEDGMSFKYELVTPVSGPTESRHSR
jgi:hypothetical protein